MATPPLSDQDFSPYIPLPRPSNLQPYYQYNPIPRPSYYQKYPHFQQNANPPPHFQPSHQHGPIQHPPNQPSCCPQYPPFQQMVNPPHPAHLQMPSNHGPAQIYPEGFMSPPLYIKQENLQQSANIFQSGFNFQPIKQEYHSQQDIFQTPSKQDQYPNLNEYYLQEFSNHHIREYYESIEYDNSSDATSDLGSSFDSSGDYQSPLKMSPKSRSEAFKAMQEELNKDFDPKYSKKTEGRTTSAKNTQNNIFANQDTYPHESIKKAPGKRKYVKKPYEKKNLYKSSKMTSGKQSSVKNPHTDSDNSVVYTEWSDEDDTLPVGWKKRSYTDPSWKTPRQPTKYQFLSPDQEIFFTRSSIVAHMKAHSYKYSIGEINRVFCGKKSSDIIVKTYLKKSAYGSFSMPYSTSNTGYTRQTKLDEQMNYETEKLCVGEISKTNQENEVETIYCQFCEIPFYDFEAWRLHEEAEAKIFEEDQSNIFENTPTIDENAIDIVEQTPTANKNVSNIFEKVQNTDENVSNMFEHTPNTDVNATNIVAYTPTTDEQIPPQIPNTNKNVFHTVENTPNTDENVAIQSMENDTVIPQLEPVAKVNPRFSDWILDETLPNGWKVRSKNIENAEKDGGMDTLYQYLSPDGKLLKSRDEATQYLKMLDNYNDDIKSTLKNISKKNENDSKTEINFDHENTHFVEELETGIEVRKSARGVWKKLDKNSKPTNEKSKPINEKSKPMKEKSKQMKEKSKPTKEKSKPRKEKSKPMQEKSKPKKIRNESNGISFSSWETNKTIMPKGWKRRERIENLVKTFQYLAPSKQVLKSANDVFIFMKNSNKYSLDETITFLSSIKKQESLSIKSDSKELKEYAFGCKFCPQTFQSTIDKENHQNEEHTGEFRYKCRECGKGNMKKANLFYHTQTKHPGENKAEQVRFDLEGLGKPEKLNDKEIVASVENMPADLIWENTDNILDQTIGQI